MAATGIEFQSARDAFRSLKIGSEWIGVEEDVFTRHYPSPADSEQWPVLMIGASPVRPMPSVMFGAFGARFGQPLSQQQVAEHRAAVKQAEEAAQRRAVDEAVQRRIAEQGPAARGRRTSGAGWNPGKRSAHLDNNVLASTEAKCAKFSKFTDEKFGETSMRILEAQRDSISENCAHLADIEVRGSVKAVVKKAEGQLNVLDFLAAHGHAWLKTQKVRDRVQGKMVWEALYASELGQLMLSNPHWEDGKHVPVFIKQCEVDLHNRFDVKNQAMENINKRTHEFVISKAELFAQTQDINLEEAKVCLYNESYKVVADQMKPCRYIGELKKMLKVLLKDYVTELDNEAQQLIHDAGDAEVDIEPHALDELLELSDEPAQKRRREAMVVEMQMPVPITVQMRTLALLGFVNIPFPEEERDEAIALWTSASARAAHPIVDGLHGCEAFRTLASTAVEVKKQRDEQSKWINTFEKKHTHLLSLIQSLRVLYVDRMGAAPTAKDKCELFKLMEAKFGDDFKLGAKGEMGTFEDVDCMITDYKSLPQEVKSEDRDIKVQQAHALLRAGIGMLCSVVHSSLQLGFECAADIGPGTPTGTMQEIAGHLQSCIGVSGVVEKLIQQTSANACIDSTDNCTTWMAFQQSSLALRHSHVLSTALGEDKEERFKKLNGKYSEWKAFKQPACFFGISGAESVSIDATNALLKTVSDQIDKDHALRVEEFEPDKINKYEQFTKYAVGNSCVDTAGAPAFLPVIMNPSGSESDPAVWHHEFFAKYDTNKIAIEALLSSMSGCPGPSVLKDHEAVAIARTDVAPRLSCTTMIIDLYCLQQDIARTFLQVFGSKPGRDMIIPSGAAMHIKNLKKTVAEFGSHRAAFDTIAEQIGDEPSSIDALFKPFVSIMPEALKKAENLCSAFDTYLCDKVKGATDCDRATMKDNYPFLSWYDFAGDPEISTWDLDKVTFWMPGRSGTQILKFREVRPARNRLVTSLGQVEIIKEAVPSTQLANLFAEIVAECNDAVAYVSCAAVHRYILQKETGGAEGEAWLTASASKARAVRASVQESGQWDQATRTLAAQNPTNQLKVHPEGDNFRFLSAGIINLMNECCEANAGGDAALALVAA